MNKILTSIALAGVLTLTATACDWEDDSQPTVVEIDVDHPSTHRKAPTYKTPKRTTPKAPLTRGRRR